MSLKATVEFGEYRVLNQGIVSPRSREIRSIQGDRFHQ